MNNQEITIAPNIIYQMIDKNDGYIYHNIKYKVPKNLVVAINGKNKNFRGFFRLVMRIGEKGYKNEIYFQFWVLEKDGFIEEYEINSKYENIEIYFNIDEGFYFILTALEKFESILLEQNLYALKMKGGSK